MIVISVSTKDNDGLAILLDSGVVFVSLRSINISTGSVEFEIEAPREVPIHRLEVFAAIQRNLKTSD